MSVFFILSVAADDLGLQYFETLVTETLVTETLVTETGHSLGGALATLAAFDIRKQLLGNQQSNTRVVCYTFAAPRTGNHAFAREYNAAVPDTWSVINDQVSPLHCCCCSEEKHMQLHGTATHMRVICNKSGVRQVAHQVWCTLST